jgi:hypothetical protein
MWPRLSLVLTLSVVVLIAAAAQVSAAPSAPAQTKTQAEIHVLRITAWSWKASRMPGLVNPHTKMLANNSQAVCHGQGGRRSGGRYTRFLCVVRPLHHRPGQGLYLSYRALANGRSVVHWLTFRALGTRPSGSIRPRR